MSMQIATRVSDEQAALFKETTRQLGTTPADALRMFISAFNDYRGFPYEVRLPRNDVEPFGTKSGERPEQSELRDDGQDRHRRPQTAGIPSRRS